jgi:hypothetical protein
VLVVRLYASDPQPLLNDVEKTLEIFQAMDAIRVAQRCASLTKEVLDIVKLALKSPPERIMDTESKQSIPEEHTKTQQEGLPSQQLQSHVMGASVSPIYLAQGDITGENIAYDTSPTFQDVPGMANDDFFANIMDVNFLNSFGANTLQFGGDFDSDFANTGTVDWNMNDFPPYDNTWGY